jgi:hypothetical protein
MKQKNKNYDLPGTFWTMPKSASTVMSMANVKEILLRYDAKILAAGYFWDIKSKRVGPGVYKVWLEQQKD